MTEFLTSMNGSLLGSFAFGFLIGLLFTSFNKFSEKI